MADLSMDTTIPLQIKPAAPPNVLAQAGQFANTANSLTQYRLLNLQLGARARLGQIAQQSVDQNGNFDYGKFANTASTDPVAAFLAPQVLGQYSQVQLAQAQLATEQQKQASSAYGDLSRALVAGSASPEMAPSVINSYMQSLPAYIQQRMAPVAKNLVDSLTAPLPNGQPVDIATYKQRTLALAAMGQANSDVRANAYGTPQVQDVGGALVPGTQSPLGQFTPSGNALSKSMTPGESATPIPGPVDTLGNPTNILKGQAASIYGNPQEGLVGPKPVTTSLGPGQSTQFKNASDLENSVNEAVENLRPIALAMKAERDASAAFQMGGGAEARGKIGKLLQAAKDAGAPITQSVVDGVANGSIANTQAFKAAMTPVIMGQFKQAVQGTGRGLMLEAKAYFDRYPGVATDPNAYETVSNMLATGFNQLLHEQQFIPQFKSGLKSGTIKDKTYADWPAEYAKTLEQGPNAQLAFPETFHGAMKPGSTAVTPDALMRILNGQ